MAAPHGPPSTADLILGGLSQYAYDRHLHNPVDSHPEFALRQSLVHTAPGQPLDDRRGETLLVNKRHEAPLTAPKDAEPGSEDARASIRRHYTSARSTRDAASLRALAEDKEALRFKVFFEEDVLGSAIERQRVRELQLWWYPSSSELRLFEPKQDNAGIVQGEFLRRGAADVLTEDGPRPVALADFCRAGAVLRLAAPPLTLTVMDADGFTRKWLDSHGLPGFGDPVRAPPSYSHPPTRRVHDWARPTTVAYDRGFETNAALGFYSRSPDVRGRFKQARGRVLRFEALLDERETAPVRSAGDLVVVAVHFFLEDETVEVIAPEGKNSGRGSCKLLSRQRVPLSDDADPPLGSAGDAVPPPEAQSAADAAATLTGRRPATASGTATPAGSDASPWAELAPAPRTAGASSSTARARLGLLSPAEAAREARAAHAALRGRSRYQFSPGSWGGTYVSPVTGRPLFGGGGVADALAEGARQPPVTHVTPDRLRAGSWLTVFGKRLWLRRADPFTVKWYRESLGIDQEAAAADGPVVAPAPRRASRPGIPPHTGATAIGDEEETRRNAPRLVPTWRPRPDFDQFFECDGKALAFRARLDRPRRGDEARRFVVTYHLVDDTLSIHEAVAPNAGRWGSRFLERGRYRVATRTGALRPEDDDDNTFGDAALRSTMMARERRLGGVGAVYGYGHGFGQGYAGGALGKEDRTGAGCTGVPAARGVGIRERVPSAPPAPFVEASDLELGGTLALAHAPGMVFRLDDADPFTRRWLARRGRLPEGEHDGAAPAPRDGPVPRLARCLAGCAASARRAMLSRDRSDAGLITVADAADVLASYGACPPDVSAADVSAVLAPHCHEGDDDPDTGAALVRWRDLCDALEAEQRDGASAGLTAAEGDPDEGMRIEQQLRSAVLSSRRHLRRCFRELGRDCPGAITPAEFRGLLRRHHLDLGMTSDDVEAAMRRYPAADPDEVAEEARARGVDAPAAAPRAAVSWRGFLWTLAGGVSGAASVSPDEVAELENIVRGITRGLEGGAGTAPEHFPHPPRAAAWGRARVAWADGTGDGWAARDVTEEEAATVRDASAPAASEAPTSAAGEAMEVEEVEAEAWREEEAASRLTSPRDGDSDGAPAPEAAAKDATASAGGEADGRSAVVGRLRAFFRGRAWDLHRTMRLYDPSLRGAVTSRALASALVSAGYELKPEEEAALMGGLHEVDWRSVVSEITA